jgi:putative ABC transport system ATP-binding protein
LLGLCAGLDRPTSGTVELLGRVLAPLSEDERAALRAREVGFVFQSFRLLQTLTALENVMVPLEIVGAPRAEQAARELLGRVGLADRVDHHPSQLSGGEQQRVAIARAFVHRPRILFADEPTGELDGDTSRAVVDLLFDLNRDAGTTLVLVTHDEELGARCERVLALKSGRVVADREAGKVAREA